MQNSMSTSYSGLCLLGTTNGCWRKSGGWGNTATEVERDCIPDYCGDKTQPVSPWCPLNSSSTHTDTHSASILLELYSHGYESAGRTRLSFAVALAIFTHTETPPLKHTLEQTQSHTDRKKKNEQVCLLSPPVFLYIWDCRWQNALCGSCSESLHDWSSISENSWVQRLRIVLQQ